MSPENGLLNGKKVGSSHLLSFKQHKIVANVYYFLICAKRKKKVYASCSASLLKSSELIPVKYLSVIHWKT